MGSQKGSKIRTGWGVVLALLLLTACGGSKQPAPTPAPAAAPAAAPQASASPAPQPAPAPPKDLGTLKLSLGTAPPDPTAHIFYYAQQQGFYKALGLNLEIMPLNGDATAMRAIASGEVDVGWNSAIVALQANESGAGLKLISCFTPKMDYLLVTTKNINRPKEIEGKKLAVSTPGAVSYQVPTMMITADGGNLDKVQVVSVGGSQSRVQALIAGNVEAAALNTLFELRTRQYSNLHTVGAALDVLPDYLYGCEMAKADTIKNKQAQLQAFVTGTINGIKWAQSNPDGAVAISQKVLPDQPKAEIDAGIREYVKKQFWNASGDLSQKAFDYSVGEAVKAGLLKSKVQLADAYYPDFVKAANK